MTAAILRLLKVLDILLGEVSDDRSDISFNN